MTLLRAETIVKRYGATEALKGVDFDVHAGAVNVLIGENGAGKSTLMKILAGVETPTSGRLLLDGKAVRIGSVKDAAAHGISIVHQELNLCPNLSVSENIFLGRQNAGLIDRRSERAETAALMKRLEQDIDPDTLVGDLRIGQQQIVEIARALSDKARVLILDEPTSALSPTEVEVLFRIIRDLKSVGTGIVYISHRLEELLRIGDHITILRDGSWQATAPVAEVSMPWIVRHMLGHDGQAAVATSRDTTAATVLSVRDLRLTRPDGGYSLDHVDLDIKAGEIVGIYGLLGAGRSELLESLVGACPARGTVRLDGKDLAGLNVSARVERGLCLVPEDRKAEGLFPNLSVGGNLGLSSLVKFSRLGLISETAAGRAIAAMIGLMGVKTASPDLSIGALSGGNQQKVVIGRCLMPGPRVLLIDEPGRGVDIGARHDIFARMRTLAEGGMSVVFTTSDMAEAQTGADRVLVMARGRITADLSPSEATEAALIAAANGVPESEMSPA
ncbi:sugar ABC transporter ATP-binding protein [Asticcacaulis sp. BYS171W]|uniref:Sugar ABC transporter ATP-binding protein n=1 Tax=Asticcacaulis aquaticus TaxID=2984212 RepID=A0ABT5HW14_9CAUL|nr:sugar ABC transporter ATP-binding protein [Asticcacaulis aquaticus]MDC7684159.1 sugar ABC transporter ATP-binding protein [Asticcacaulis aquaticus]